MHHIQPLSTRSHHSAERAINVPLAAALSGMPRSVTGSLHGRSETLARVDTAICKQVLTPLQARDHWFDGRNATNEYPVSLCEAGGARFGEDFRIGAQPENPSQHTCFGAARPDSLSDHL